MKEIKNKKSSSTWLKTISLEPIIYIISLVFLAILVRLPLLPFISPDMSTCLLPWMNIIDQNKFKSLAMNFSDYNMPYLYFMLLISYIKSIPYSTSIKFISIIFEFLTCSFVYVLVKEKFKDRNILIPIFAFAVILFAPTVLTNGAFWGQCDIIYTFFVVASLYYLIKDRPSLACILYGIGFSFKLQAIFVAPILLLLFIKDKISLKNLLLIPLTCIAVMIPSYLAGRPFLDVINIYLNQAKSYDYALTLNAPNLYQWINNGYLQYFKTPGIIVTFAIVVASVVFLSKNIKKLTPEKIFTIALFYSLIVPFFLPKMHERYFFMADILSIIYAFYFPKKYYLAILVSLVSLFSYMPFLNGSASIELKYLAFVLLFVIIIVTKDLYELCANETNPTENHKILPKMNRNQV